MPKKSRQSRRKNACIGSSPAVAAAAPRTAPNVAQTLWPTLAQLRNAPAVPLRPLGQCPYRFDMSF